MALSPTIRENSSASSQTEKDAQDLKKLGYVQELLREMGGFSSFAVSFSVISILTGAIQLYGYGLQHGGPLQISLGWWLVSLFTLMVALSMAELASAYPTAGALYHWSSYLGGRALGWFTACFNTVGQFAILAGIDYGLTQLLIPVLKVPNTLPISFGIYGFILLSHAWLNHRGIHWVSRLNRFSAWYHIGVVVLLVGALLSRGLPQSGAFLWKFNSTDGFSPKHSFLVGLLLAQWTLTGYDASAHTTEETIDPRRNAPWGIFLAVLISVVAGSVMLSVITMSIPDLPQAIAFGDNAFAEILKLRLGTGFGNTLVVLILGAMWLCGLASLTSASRMVYAFARDGGLPGSRYLAKVSPVNRTPAHAIWMISGFALVLAASVQVYSAVVSIATIALYLSYGLPIAARVWLRVRGREKVKGPWNLGFLSTPVAVVGLLWVVFITIIFVLPPNGQAGLVMFAITSLLLLIWFFRARSRFTGPKIGFED